MSLDHCHALDLTLNHSGLKKKIVKEGDDPLPPISSLLSESGRQQQSFWVQGLLLSLPSFVKIHQAVLQKKSKIKVVDKLRTMHDALAQVHSRLWLAILLTINYFYW